MYNYQNFIPLFGTIDVASENSNASSEVKNDSSSEAFTVITTTETTTTTENPIQGNISTLHRQPEQVHISLGGDFISFF